MLLVDVPHLASVAERTGALECITDERLQPVVSAVVDGAKEGRNPDLQDLLTSVDPGAHQQLYDTVLSGEYRGLADQGADPQTVLANLVRACRSEALEQRIVDVKAQMRDAQSSGFPERASELAQVWMELRREQNRLLNASGPLADVAPNSEAGHSSDAQPERSPEADAPPLRLPDLPN